MPEVFSVDEISKITAMLARRQSEGLTDEVASECIQRLQNYKPKVDYGSLSDDEVRALMNDLNK